MRSCSCICSVCVHSLPIISVYYIAAGSKNQDIGVGKRAQLLNMEQSGAVLFRRPRRAGNVLSTPPALDPVGLRTYARRTAAMAFDVPIHVQLCSCGARFGIVRRVNRPFAGPASVCAVFPPRFPQLLVNLENCGVY